MNYVIWNNIDSRDIKGLLICELPPITKPNMRVKETAIDGVDGSIIEELGYESYDKTMTIALRAGADIDKIMEYFTGNGELVFSNEPSKYYRARIIKSIDYARLLRYRTAKVTFRVQPFKYDLLEVERVATSERDSMIVENIGNHTAKPLITVTGRGTVMLYVNGKEACVINFKQGESSTITLDCEKQDAYNELGYQNDKMRGYFPILEKGNNTISWSKDYFESIQIKRYSRWL